MIKYPSTTSFLQNILFQLTCVVCSLRRAPVQNKSWRPSLRADVATLFAEGTVERLKKSTNAKYTYWQLFGEGQINQKD